MHGNKEIDELSGTETTGHEWDGIKELNTPLPRWWLWTFYGSHRLGDRLCRSCIPAMPLIGGATPRACSAGRAAASSTSRWTRPQCGAQADLVARSPTDVADIIANPELAALRPCGRRVAVQGELHPVPRLGRRRVRPAIPTSTTTTGSGAARRRRSTRRSRTAPATQADEDTRTSEMPAFGEDAFLDRDQIDEVAGYVLSLSGMDHDAGTRRGQDAVRRQLRLLPWRGRPGRHHGSARRRSTTPSGSTAARPRRSSPRSQSPRQGVMPAWGAKPRRHGGQGTGRLRPQPRRRAVDRRRRGLCPMTIGAARGAERWGCQQMLDMLQSRVFLSVRR